MEIRGIMKKGWLLVAFVGAVLILQGCLKTDNNVYDGYKYLQEDINTLQNYFTANNIDVMMDSSSGVFYSIDGKGDGYKTVNNAEVEIQYQGETLDGVEFVNNFSGNPIGFTLGDKSTYPASLTEGVIIGIFKMFEGDTATIYVPSPYGFQDKGYQGVPPNTILVYKVRFVKIKNLDTDLAKIDQYILDNNMNASIDTIFGTRYEIHRVGNGISPKIGAAVSLDYQGELLDGTVFDNSYDRGSPLNFTYGNGDLIVGFELGVTWLHENDSATFFIPSIYGYKDAAQGDIPANSVLVFGVDIKRISNPN